MTTAQTRGHQVTNPYFLSQGSHPDGDAGRCAMEWVAYLAGEPHSDHPVCVSPVLTRFCVSLNDAMGDRERQKLRPYLARTIGTAGDGLDQRRSFMCLDWLIRTYAPAWLDLAGLAGDAKALRDLPEIVDVETARRAAPIARRARARAAAAAAAAGDAAWAAAWDAAWAAARDAARDAAWAAAGDAAWDAAWDAAYGTLRGTLRGTQPGTLRGPQRGPVGRWRPPSPSSKHPPSPCSTGCSRTSRSTCPPTSTRAI
jgi:hypothetical protein